MLVVNSRPVYARRGASPRNADGLEDITQDKLRTKSTKIIHNYSKSDVLPSLHDKGDAWQLSA